MLFLNSATAGQNLWSLYTNQTRDPCS